MIDFILHIDQHLLSLTSQYGAWIYAILFLIVFCETGLVVTPFLPGDSMLFAAGSIAALGQMNVHGLAFLLWIAAVLGDSVNFMAGKLLGEKLFADPNSKIFKQAYLHKTEDFYRQHGGKTILLARFIPIIRTFAPFVAGMGHMQYRRFFSYNIMGGAVWVVLFVYGGYFFGNTEIVRNNLSLVLLMIIILSLLPMVIEIIRHKYGKK